MVEYLERRAAVSRRRAAGERVASLLGRIDWVLMAAVLGLVGYGLWAIEGITRHDIPGDPSYYLVRQAVFAAVGLALMAVAACVDPAW